MGGTIPGFDKALPPSQVGPKINRIREEQVARVACGHACSVSIMRRRNERPALTTLQTWFRSPTNDSSSLQVQHFLSPHAASKDCSLANLSLGRYNSPTMVSTVEPLLADTLNSRHLPYNGQSAKYQLLSHIKLYFKNRIAEL